MKVSEDGGVPTEATAPQRGDATHRYPVFLPDGRHFIYLAAKASVGPELGGTIRLASIDSNADKELLRATSSVAYSPTGHLVYWRDHTLVAQMFDTKTLTVGQNLIPIAEKVERNARGDAYFSI